MMWKSKERTHTNVYDIKIENNIKYCMIIPHSLVYNIYICFCVLVWLVTVV